MEDAGHLCSLSETSFSNKKAVWMLHERLNFRFMGKIDVPRWNVSDKERIFTLEHQPVSSCVTVLLMYNDINCSPNFTKSKVKLNVESYSNIT